MPRTSGEWAGAAAMWITAAGWAAAGRRRFGHGWVVTPGRVDTPEAVIGFTDAQGAAGDGAGLRSRVPEVVKTGVKDLRRLWASERYRRGPLHGPWELTDVQLVWQHHDLFHRSGEVISRRLGRPLVSYVHAPQVWEAARWGVARPGWGRLIERFGERPGLVHSDVVACVSDEVAREVLRFGVRAERVVVAPMAVDADRFSPEVSGATVRQRLGIDPDAVVVGWTGSFRRFHGLELGLEAFASVHRREPSACLLLVGDGPERTELADAARRLGVADAVVFSGAVGHASMPEMVAAMDVTFVVARQGEGFHYSPLKMREYMAVGKPVVAPDVGEIPSVVDEGVSGLLYAAGDPSALADRLHTLVTSADDRRRLGGAARQWVLREGTWDVQLDRVISKLTELGLLGASTP